MQVAEVLSDLTSLQVCVCYKTVNVQPKSIG